MATAKIVLSLGSYSYTNTAQTVPVYLYYYGNTVSWSNYKRPWSISATGQSTVSGTSSFTKSTSAQLLGSTSFTWSRGTSNESKSLSASFATGVSIGTLTCSTSLTVYAKPSYTVTYYNINNANSSTSYSVQYGSYHYLLTPSSVKDYKFVGWRHSNGSIYSAGTGITVTGDISYTGVWELNVSKFTIGSTTVNQSYSSAVSSALQNQITSYVNAYNKSDTNFIGLVDSSNKELIVKVNSNKSWSFVSSSLFYQNSSGTWVYKGNKASVTLEYKYEYLKHNIYTYYINSSGGISYFKDTDISGTFIGFRDTTSISGYNFSHHYKEVSKPPTSVNDFIKIDSYTTEETLKLAGYESSTKMTTKDRYFAAVYVTNKTEQQNTTKYQTHSYTRTDLLGTKKFINGNILEYITPSNQFSEDITKENGLYLCGYVKYTSPYLMSDNSLHDINNNIITPLKGIINDNNSINISISGENLEYKLEFIENELYIKFVSKNPYPLTNTYYIECQIVNALNDLNYPVSNTILSLLLPSEKIVLDINKNKNVLCIGGEASDDVTDNMVTFKWPIVFNEGSAKYSQFIISHSTNIVNLTSGKYLVTTDCKLLKGSDSLDIYKNDIVTIVNSSGKLSLIIDRNTESIIYKTIDATNSFKILGTTYKAEGLMTWKDWINSKYNTNGFYIGDKCGLIHIPDSDSIIVNDVLPEDEIIPDYEYSTKINNCCNN